MPNVFDSSSAAVGAVQSAMLTEAQFQAQFGTGWVLARGQSVSGSKYAALTGNSTLPDLRGVFLRGKNNGRTGSYANPDGDVALGTQQLDAMIQHYHAAPTNSGTAGSEYAGGSTYDFFPLVYTQGAVDASGNSLGGNENRSKNVTVNYFIRIN